MNREIPGIFYSNEGRGTNEEGQEGKGDGERSKVKDGEGKRTTNERPRQQIVTKLELTPASMSAKLIRSSGEVTSVNGDGRRTGQSRGGRGPGSRPDAGRGISTSRTGGRSAAGTWTDGWRREERPLGESGRFPVENSPFIWPTQCQINPNARPSLGIKGS